jgi:hypothetical protein
MKLTTMKWTAAAILAAGLCGTANATPMDWTSTVNFPEPVLLSGVLDTQDFTHTLQGFNVGTDTVSSYTLAFDLYDDENDSFWDTVEAAIFSQPGYLIDTVWFNLSGNETAGWSLAGRAELNSSGSLQVSITSLFGDFYLGGSTLNAHGDRNSVPEPGTLALFGVALIGFGLMRRKRQTF